MIDNLARDAAAGERPAPDAAGAGSVPGTDAGPGAGSAARGAAAGRQQTPRRRRGYLKRRRPAPARAAVAGRCFNRRMDTRTALPSIFLSHGSPMIALEPGAAGEFMQRLGPAIDAAFGRPRAVLAVSAHTVTGTPLLLAAPRHEAVHDFGGFPDALYRLRYDAPARPQLAVQVRELLAAAGIASIVLPEGGLDHGIWTALRHVWPAADVPVLPLALVPTMATARLHALGEALGALRRDGVLVLGTGSITHNLRLVARSRRRRAAAGTPGSAADVDEPDEMPESRAFRDWFAERSAARDWEALFDYRRQAPHAELMHPTDEHLLPWFAAAGAGGRDATPLRLHEGVTLGCLGMDAYAFGDEAGLLAQALAGAGPFSGGPARAASPQAPAAD